jgi:hypothetical protein
MLEASTREAARRVSIKYRTFAHHVFASGRRTVLGFDGKPEVKDSLDDLGVDGRILKWIF